MMMMMMRMWWWTTMMMMEKEWEEEQEERYLVKDLDSIVGPVERVWKDTEGVDGEGFARRSRDLTIWRRVRGRNEWRSRRRSRVETPETPRSFGKRSRATRATRRWTAPSL